MGRGREGICSPEKRKGKSEHDWEQGGGAFRLRQDPPQRLPLKQQCMQFTEQCGRAFLASVWRLGFALHLDGIDKSAPGMCHAASVDQILRADVFFHRRQIHRCGGFRHSL